MKTEKEKMLNSEMYQAFDEELVSLRTKCRLLLSEFNASSPQDFQKREEILEELLGKKTKGTIIEPPFHCDYGINIELGDDVYMNFGCTILDCAKVTIGSNTLLAPNVQIYTPGHPLDFKTRNTFLEFAKPVSIGKNCWIGGSVVILPGVSIGDGCVIGAGAVVTKDIRANSLAFGNPARVIREIDNSKA